MAPNDTAVRLAGVRKVFGSQVAVAGVDLTVREGTLTSLLGPSGCGKTTLLRLLAGLELPTEGAIEIRGRDVVTVPIHKRNIGLVFQNYALFPHKTVGDNIAFGLKHRGCDRTTAAAKVKRALEMVRLPQLHDRMPNELSGGQQQRVALARAVVFEPDVLLLDEPLSALDANLREQMRFEIKRIQKELALTTILVTHDQHEALAMSDEIVVMNQGRVQQVGSPESVYRMPSNRFVAGFLGVTNLLTGRVASTTTNDGPLVTHIGDHTRLSGMPRGTLMRRNSAQLLDPVDVFVRAADVHISPLERVPEPVQLNEYLGTIEDASYLGDFVLYLVNLGEVRLKATSRANAGESADLPAIAVGDRVRVSIAPKDCSILLADAN